MRGVYDPSARRDDRSAVQGSLERSNQATRIEVASISTGFLRPMWWGEVLGCMVGNRAGAPVHGSPSIEKRVVRGR